jgi:hypothetical protein
MEIKLEILGINGKYSKKSLESQKNSQKSWGVKEKYATSHIAPP